MMKLFLTGATGYIGGDALHLVVSTYPDLEITTLARNSEKGSKIVSKYPKVKLVYGDLDNAELLTFEATKADIVLDFASADHPGAANSLVEGLAQRSTPGYLIHVSGTGGYGWPDFNRKTFGRFEEKTYDDWDGIAETLLPEHYTHAAVDRIIVKASEKNPGKIFSAVVAPPVIYGPGRGPDNQRSIQGPDMVRAALKRGKAFQVGEGKNIWHQIHVQDLSEIFLALVTSAMQPDGGAATWNEKGYYFAENGPLEFGELARRTAQIAAEKKYIQTTEVDSLGYEEVDALRAHGAHLWGTNARVTGIRGHKLLGWTPKQKNFFELLPDLVNREAKDLGLVKDHAAKASGEA